MARVTKINVGGTNYDIAHEGQLKNSGFEVVTSLPTKGLFAGREVMYNGKKYVYSSGWKEEITANTMYEDKLVYNTGTIVPDGSVIDKLLRVNVYAFTKPDAISVQYSQDAGVTWVDYPLSDIDKQNLCTFTKNIYCGGPDVTSGNINYRLRVNLFPKINYIGIFHKIKLHFVYSSSYNRWLTVKCLRKNQEDIDANYVTIIDKGNISGGSGTVLVNLGNIDMYNNYDKVVLDIGYDGVGTGKGLSLDLLSMYATYADPSNYLAKYGRMYHYDINKNSYFDGSVNSKEIINFDVNNIEPTQTGSSVSKSSTWLWQYLVQGVNWLRANNVRLSAYNTKIAALEQADSDNNASIQSVSTDLTELSNGLATVATSGSYEDLTNNPTQLPNPNPIIIKTADGVSVRYDGSTSGGVTLEAGNNAELTATQDSNDKMTVKFGAVVPQTLPNPNALNIMVLDSEGALLGPSIVYDGVATKYINLIEGYGITLSNSNLSTGQAITINLKQIAGTTLLGNANDTIGIPQAVTMTQLRTMLGSLTLNDIDVTLGGNNSYTLPCYIDYNGVDYPARIRDNWLQIYRNGVWANLYYLLSSLPTECRYITDLSDPSWYDESVTEYELDNSATEQLLLADSSTNIANWIEAINANQITFNSSVIASKRFNKGALDNIISNLKGKGYSVFVENDIDTILSSGNDWVISIKIKRFNNLYKAIIECYVAR